MGDHMERYGVPPWQPKDHLRLARESSAPLVHRESESKVEGASSPNHGDTFCPAPSLPGRGIGGSTEEYWTAGRGRTLRGRECQLISRHGTTQTGGWAKVWRCGRGFWAASDGWAEER